MPSLIVDEAPVNGVAANGVKVDGVHTEEYAMAPVVPVATPADTPSMPETDGDTPGKEGEPEEDEPEEDELKKEDESEKEGEPKKDDESEEDKEIKARKKALDALNAQYKDVPPGSRPELVHLDKVLIILVLFLLAT
jgi:hypothetical protein